MQRAVSATEYRLLVEHSPVMIWRAGLDAACDYFNDTWLAFTGRTMAQEVGNGWAEGVHPDDLDRCVKYYLDHFHRREPFEMEYRLRRHDGVYRWIFDRGVPFNDDSGTFAGFIGSCVDIDERWRAQKRDEDQLAYARGFERWVLAIVSHDIRNPLGAISALAQMLKRKADAADSVRDFAERITRSVTRIERIVADLLDVSRERHGGGVPITIGPTDARAICQQVVDELSAVAAGRAITLDANGETSGDWDAHRLTQAISNMVSNAVQHGAPDTPIDVIVRGERERVVIAVHNAGHIPPETLPHVFAPFRSGERVAKGLGLGLFIAQAIVRAHHGSLDVESTPGRGTRFSLTLPRRAPVDAAVALSP